MSINTKALNPRERYVYGQLKAAGYSVYRHGWPDFLAVKGKHVRFVEVKSTLDKLGVDQKRMHRVLAKLGFKVDVFYLNERFSY